MPRSKTRPSDAPLAVGGVKWLFKAFQTVPANQQVESDFLTVAASLAVKSAHPGAADIDRVAAANGAQHRDVIGFQDFPGQGFGGAVRLAGEEMPRAVLIGEEKFLANAGLQTPDLLIVAARRWQKEGGRVLYAGWDGWVRAVLNFR